MTGKDAIEGLNRGAVISLVAKAYEYHHKQFGNGVSQSLKAVVVMKPAVNEEDAMTSEYLDELKDDGYSDEDKSDPEAALDVLDDEAINLDDIPF